MIVKTETVAETVLPGIRSDLAPAAATDDARVVGYAYERLDATEAEIARAAADRIRGRMKATTRAVIEVGIELRNVKDRIPHGEFGPWAAIDLGMSERTVQNYMRAATVFCDSVEIVAVLPPATVYALAAPSTPETIRAEVLRQIEEGERLEPAAIRETITAAKKAERERHDAEREAARLAKLSPEQRADLDRKAKRRRQSREQREAERTRQIEADRAEQRAAENAADEIAHMIADYLDASELTQVLASSEGGRVWHRVQGRLKAIAAERQAPRAAAA